MVNYIEHVGQIFIRFTTRHNKSKFFFSVFSINVLIAMRIPVVRARLMLIIDISLEIPTSLHSAIVWYSVETTTVRVYRVQ